MFRRGCMFAQNPVHPETHLKVFRQRFDVNIAGTLLYGFSQKLIDQFDNRRFGSEITQMIGIITKPDNRIHFGKVIGFRTLGSTLI